MVRWHHGCFALRLIQKQISNRIYNPEGTQRVHCLVPADLDAVSGGQRDQRFSSHKFSPEKSIGLQTTDLIKSDGRVGASRVDHEHGRQLLDVPA